MEKLRKLRPAFGEKGTVTAGNASSINDGAAAVPVLAGDKVKELGVTPQARILGYAIFSREPDQPFCRARIRHLSNRLGRADLCGPPPDHRRPLQRLPFQRGGFRAPTGINTQNQPARPEHDVRGQAHRGSAQDHLPGAEPHGQGRRPRYLRAKPAFHRPHQLEGPQIRGRSCGPHRPGDRW